MIETVLGFWHNIPLILRIPVEFWLSIIVMRGIVAKDITSWLEDRGFIKKKEQSLIYRSLDYTYSHVKSLVPRKAAIWDHFKHGHSTDLTKCNQDNCAVFRV